MGGGIGRGAVVLFRCGCFHLRHEMSASGRDRRSVKELRTLNATGALFGFSSFRVSVTSWLKGPIQASGQRILSRSRRV
jgi:hypothetical protein